MAQETFAVLSAASIHALNDTTTSFSPIQSDLLLFPSPRKWRSETAVVDAKVSTEELTLRKSVARSIGKDLLRFESASWISHDKLNQGSLSHQIPHVESNEFTNLTQSIAYKDFFAVLSATSIHPTQDSADVFLLLKSSDFPPPKKNWSYEGKELATRDLEEVDC